MQLATRVLWVWLGTLVLLGNVNSLAQAATGVLQRTNLLAYLDDNGVVRPVLGVSDWERRRTSILKAAQEVMGPLPGPEKRCALDVKVEEESDCGEFRRQRISYSAEPGSRVPAYLLIPRQTSLPRAKFPGVLALHQTHALGQKVVAGLGNSPDDEYGVELARRGYVVLCPPYPQLADYHPDLRRLGYQSGTMKAIWDNMRGLDLLCSLPFLRTNGFGAIGHSLGGHNGVYTAVFDPRLKVVVSSCGLDAFRDYMNGNITGWTSSRYMPRLLQYPLAGIPFDFDELIGAIAPRACLIIAPLGDTNFKWQSVDNIARAAGPIFRLHGVPGHLQVEHPRCGHLFPSEMRQLAYGVLDRHLR